MLNLKKGGKYPNKNNIMQSQKRAGKDRSKKGCAITLENSAGNAEPKMGGKTPK